MPSMKRELRAMDEALAEMDEIGYDGWRAKQAYINGDIGEDELERRLERSMGIGKGGDER